MKKTLSILILFFILFSQGSFACTCPGDWSFCETIDSSFSILEVEVTAKYGSPQLEHMDIRILETVQNGIAEDSLTVTTNGILCEFPLEMFNIGDTLLINLNQITPSDSLENHPGIKFSLCYTNFLRLSKSSLSGFISPSLNSQNYVDFKNQLGQCIDIISSNETLEKLKREIKILKNPTSDFSIIDFGDLETSKISLEIFSSKGQQMSSMQSILNLTHPIPFNDFPIGIYFIKIQYKDNFILKKIVKI